MDPIYYHCQNCHTPTISDSRFCQDCNPTISRIILNFGKDRRTLENLRFIARLKELKPSDYVVELIKSAVDKQIEELNRKMKN